MAIEIMAINLQAGDRLPSGATVGDVFYFPGDGEVQFTAGYRWCELSADYVLTVIR